jgi:alkanesulfonate monooxygenase SsuD/methylene tetrahydromethanopterin reductase-like flavin-dependent oxidoreductase (luciferase family)
MTEEFEALGVPFRQRGALTTESMEIMREPMEQIPTRATRAPRWNLSGFKFAPKPRQQPGIPLWVGGASPARLRPRGHARRRVAPHRHACRRVQRRRQEVRKLAAAAGRDPDALTMSIRWKWM